LSLLGVVTALPREASTLGGGRVAAGEVLSLADHTLLSCGGIGPSSAESAARKLVQRGVTALASWGIAGGLDPVLEPGGLLLPKNIRSDRGEEFAVDGHWRARLIETLGSAAHSGTLIESGRVIASAADKAALFRETGAAAVDMESAAIAAVAHESDLPFVVLRTVCDPASGSLPPAALVAVDESGRTRLLPLARSLIRRPGQVLALFTLLRQANAAIAALREAARLLGPGLCAPSTP
jgi:adenosylhomocysteine nucleosidase